jgi:hypothetical protein
VLLLAVTDDWDSITGYDVCNNVLHGSHILSIVCKADDIVVLYKVAEYGYARLLLANIFDSVGQLLHVS